MRGFEAGKFHNVSKWEEEESRKNHTVIIMSIFIISRRLEMAESSKLPNAAIFYMDGGNSTEHVQIKRALEMRVSHH